MNKLKELAFTFSCITTGSLFCAAIFISICYKEETISTYTLWQLLFTSFVCTLGNFLYPTRKLTKNLLYAINVLHYLYINSVVIGSGLVFEWFYIDQFPMILFMCFLIGIVFLIISVIVHEKAKKDTELLNSRLREYKRKNKEV